MRRYSRTSYHMRLVFDKEKKIFWWYYKSDAVHEMFKFSSQCDLGSIENQIIFSRGTQVIAENLKNIELYHIIWIVRNSSIKYFLIEIIYGIPSVVSLLGSNIIMYIHIAKAYRLKYVWSNKL